MGSSISHSRNPNGPNNPHGDTTSWTPGPQLVQTKAPDAYGPSDNHFALVTNVYSKTDADKTFVQKSDIQKAYGTCDGSGFQTVPSDKDTTLSSYWTNAAVMNGLTYADGSFRVPRAGQYIITATTFLKDNSGSAELWVTTNNMRKNSYNRATSTTATLQPALGISCSSVLSLMPTDTVSVTVRQNSGGPIDTDESMIGSFTVREL
jgi:hypothetical protein